MRYRFDYQTFGNRPYLLTRITAMNGQETTLDRDPATGDPREIRAPFGRVTTVRVIASGERPLDRVTNPDGDIVELDPNSATEQLNRMKDPRGFWHRYEYDAVGRLVGDYAPDSFATTIALESLPADSIGDRTIVATSRQGRVSRYAVDNVLVGSRLWDYRCDDGTGRLTRVQDPLTRETAFEYDGADRLTRQTLPDLSTIGCQPFSPEGETPVFAR